jgi:hypothetical protein
VAVATALANVTKVFQMTLIKVTMMKLKKKSPYFYIAWTFFINGKKYSKGAQFPFSMS